MLSGRVRGPFTAQDSSAASVGGREWVGGALEMRRLMMELFLFSQVLLTPLLAWYWWMVVAFYAWSGFDLSARFVFIFTVM